MQNTHSNQNTNFSINEIDLRDLFNTLIQGKWIILSVTSLVSIAAVIYSLSLPNIYQSRALLAPVNSSSSISGSLAGYSGLAGMAGISLPSEDGESNSKKAMVKLKSLSFFENNILPKIFLPDLMAIESGNFMTKKITYDKNIYNLNSNTWVDDSYPLNSQPPSAQLSFIRFLGHMNLSEDIKTGFVTLSIKHQSPLIAKQWTELIVKEINAFYSHKDKSEAQKSVNYLSTQIAMTSLSEIKQAIAQLLQQETQKLTLIESNQDYVFEYIDPPVVMEEKSEPKRAQICILGGLLGGILGIFIVLIRRYGSDSKDY